MLPERSITIVTSRLRRWASCEMRVGMPASSRKYPPPMAGSGYEKSDAATPLRSSRAESRNAPGWRRPADFTFSVRWRGSWRCTMSSWLGE